MMSDYSAQNSFVPNCAGGSNCKFLGKNPRFHLIVIRELPKNTLTPYHFKKS